MAMSPGSRRRDNRTTDDPQDPASLNPMQEPLGSMDRPISRTSDDNDLNISSNGTGRTAGNLGRTGTVDNRRSSSGFMTTFAIIAAILVAAFLIALYVNSDRTNVATTPSTTGDTTGSTTPATPPATTQDTAPATGDTGNTGTGTDTDTGTGTGTGSGTTPPANP